MNLSIEDKIFAVAIISLMIASCAFIRYGKISVANRLLANATRARTRLRVHEILAFTSIFVVGGVLLLIFLMKNYSSFMLMKYVIGANLFFMLAPYISMITLEYSDGVICEKRLSDAFFLGVFGLLMIFILVGLVCANMYMTNP